MRKTPNGINDLRVGCGVLWSPWRSDPKTGGIAYPVAQKSQ